MLPGGWLALREMMKVIRVRAVMKVLRMMEVIGMIEVGG